MKKLVCLTMVLVMVSIIQAGTVSFSSRDWATRETGGAYGAPSYVVNDSESATATGAFTVSAMMYTEFGVSVGDVVSYDVTSTKELRNNWGGGDSDWIGDMWTGFIGLADVAQLEDYSYATVIRDVFYTAVDLTYVWTFTSATTVDVDVTDNTTATTTTFTDIALNGDISGITGFAAANWDTEQDTTLSNFVHVPVPEPATMVLLGLGGLLIRRKIR